MHDRVFCLPAYASGDLPSPAPTASPSATPRTEPSPSPSATPSATPRPEPSASPTATPRVEPSASPTATPHTEPSATPSPTPGGDDHGGPSPSPSATPDGDSGGDHGEKSLHGLYEGTTSAGAIAIFYIEKNTHLQINLLDLTGQTIGFAEGTMTNGAFAFTLSNGQSMAGTATEKLISGTVAGSSFQAQRASELGDRAVTGRFTGVAHGPMARAASCSSSTLRSTSRSSRSMALRRT